MKQLRIYINPACKELTIRQSPLVYPYWGHGDVRATVANQDAFLKHQFDARFYTFTDNPDECDCHLWPFNYWATQKSGNSAHFEHALVSAGSHNKKLLIDAFGDTMDALPYSGVIVLRFAQYRRNIKDNDIIVPAYVEDLLETYYQGSLSLRNKQEKPVVGFAGWGSFPFWKHIRSYIKEAPIFLWSLVQPSYGIFRKGVFLRGSALASLMKNIHVQTAFLIRSSYSGNVRTAEKNLQDLRQEFVNNINSTDYTLCQKGDANQSTRFFEVISLGRIPLVIDTECVFPLEDIINYREFCVFVDYTKTLQTGDVLSRIHAEISPETFESMQKRAREVYETYLRIDSYTPFLMEEIEKRL